MTNYNTRENNPYYSGIEYLNTNREIFFSTIRNMQLLWEEYWKIWTGEYIKKPNTKVL
jgi:hypothetical protein